MFRRHLVLALAAALVLLPAAGWPFGSTPLRFPDTHGYDVTFNTGDSTGVSLIGPAFRSADADFTLGASFSGELFGCNLADADADDNGTVDAAAECVSISTLTGDTTFDASTKKLFYVVDVNTANTGSQTSRLILKGDYGIAKGGGAQTPWASDIDPATFSLSFQTGISVDGTTTTDTQELVNRTVRQGPLWTCATAGESSFDQNACNENSDCPTSSNCQQNPTTDILSYDALALSPTTSNGEPLDGSEWLGIDAVFKLFCYNTAADCNDSSSDDTDYATWTMQFESDYRPHNTSTAGQERLFEWILQMYPARATPVTGSEFMRPWFLLVNHYPFHLNDNGYTLLPTAMAQDGFLTYSAATENARAFKLFQAGHKGKAFPGMKLSYDSDTPAGTTIDARTSDQFGTSSIVRPDTGWGSAWDDDFWSGTAMRTAVRAYMVNQKDTSQASYGVESRLAQGINPYGACDVNSDVAEGTPCVWNEECNSGNPYDGGANNGICVKGNGVNSSGSADGVCVQDASGSDNDHDCASVQQWLADTGTCRSAPTGGSGAVSISSLCDVVGSACDTTGTCIDIQEWFVPNVGTQVGVQAEAEYERAGQSTATSLSYLPGYCSGATNAWEEGQVCTQDADCTDTCTKNTNDPVHVQIMAAQSVLVDLQSDRDEANADATTWSGAFNIGVREIDRAIGTQYQLTTGTGNTVYVQQSSMMRFLSPTISGSPTLSNAEVIGFDNQWASASYRPNLLKFDDQTNTGSGANWMINIESPGWDDGSIRLGDARLFSASSGGGATGTNDRLEIQWNANPSSSTSGQTLLQSSGSATTGVMHWGDGSTVTTGNDACANANYGLTCFDSDLMGSSGGATTCATTHAAPFWAMCY